MKKVLALLVVSVWLVGCGSPGDKPSMTPEQAVTAHIEKAQDIERKLTTEMQNMVHQVNMKMQEVAVSGEAYPSEEAIAEMVLEYFKPRIDALREQLELTKEDIESKLPEELGPEWQGAISGLSGLAGPFAPAAGLFGTTLLAWISRQRMKKGLDATIGGFDLVLGGLKDDLKGDALKAMKSVHKATNTREIIDALRR